MNNPLLSLLIGAAVVGVLVWFFWPDVGLLYRWRAIRRVTDRVLQEDALKHIQKLDFSGRAASLQSVAGALNVDSNQTANVLAELEARGLITRNGDDLHLTSQGQQVALNVIRAHRLWEQYLAQHSGFRQAEWHTQADWFEHLLSPEDLDDLAGSLGNPLYDPHGDPIPNREGKVWEREGIPLTNLQIDQTARIVHVGDEPEMVAAQIQAEGLLPGMLLRVLEVSSQRVRFWADGGEHVLAPIVAASIKVLLVEEQLHQQAEAGVPLSELAEGQQGRVLSLSPRIHGAERRRLFDLGMLPGTVVEATLVSPLGDPVAYRVRDALIALRQEQARCIQVEPLSQEVIK